MAEQASDQQLSDLQAEARRLKAQLASTEQPTQDAQWWSNTNAMTISSAVLVFGFFTICLTAWLLRRERQSLIILRTLATILILTFAVFLIVAGYSDQQIAPAMGLLGTIAGYLLGKEVREAPANATDERARPG